jgi:protein TonB
VFRFFVYPGVWRGGIFGFVACAHALFLTALSLAKAPEPPVDNRPPIMVELLPTALPLAPGPPEPEPESRAAEPEPKAPEPEPRAVEPEQPPVQPVVEPPPPPPEPVRKRPVRPRKAVPVVKAPPPAIIEETASNEAPSAGAATPTPLAEAPTVFGRGAPGNAASESGPVKSGASGGGDSQARFDADYLNNPKPPYPPLSRRMREEGRVVLRVLVTVDGGASDVEVRASSGSARLDESALRTIQRWKFIPARRGRTPVQSWVLVPVIFKLES